MDGQAHYENVKIYKKQMQYIDLLRAGNDRLPQKGDRLKAVVKEYGSDLRHSWVQILAGSSFLFFGKGNLRNLIFLMEVLLSQRCCF